MESKTEFVAETIDFAKVKIPELVVPYLHEIWNWQGDTSVLPFKFESILNSASSGPIKQLKNAKVSKSFDDDDSGADDFLPEKYYNHKALKDTWITRQDFDPMGFFFLTYRSNANGLA